MPRRLLATVAAVLAVAGLAGCLTPRPPAPVVAFEKAQRAEDYDAAAAALEAFMREGPALPALLDENQVVDVLDNAEALAEGTPRRAAMLDALFEAGWTPKNPAWTFSSYWREVVLNRIEAGRIDAARAAAARIDHYGSVIRMRADRRFDPVTRVPPGLPDPAQLLEVWVARARAAGDARQIAGMLLTKGEPGEALAVLEAALEPTGLENWERGVLLYNRARALKELGRTDEAVDALRQSAALGSHWTLDLANFLMAHDRGPEAVAALDAVDQSDWTPRQQALAATWRFCSLVLSGQAADAEQLMNMSPALGPDERVAMRGNLLFCAGRADEAAEFYKQTLADPRLRGGFLFGLQRFAPSPHPSPGGQRLEAWRRTILDRPDVREALDRVGRIEAYPMRSPPNDG